MLGIVLMSLLGYTSQIARFKLGPSSPSFEVERWGKSMAREASLFDESEGSPLLRAYTLLKKRGSANIPPSWIDRARQSRKTRESMVANALKKQKRKPADSALLKDWDLAFRKECFYHGLRVLLELERKGKSKL